jgi:succinoglycan biosynthesis transport protein ExoP
MVTATATSEGSSGWFLNHLPDIFWQRRITIFSALVIAFLASLIAAYVLPTVYRSSATLLVQAQDLPSELVDAPATGAIEQRIARIRERVLSRGDLVALIEQNDLYPTERRRKPLSKIVEKMRKATTVSALQNDIGKPGSQDNNTIAINVSFDYPDPSKAQAILQSYVANFLRMDSDDVEDQANISVRFLQDQAAKLATQIREIEGQLTALKARNGAALASSGMPAMIDTGSYSAQIAGFQSENRQLIAQLQKRPDRDPQIAAAEAALAAARATYNDSHPDVIQARERLRELRLMEQASPQDDGSSSIREQIAANNSAIASLSQAKNSALSRAGASLAGQARAPAILEQAMQLENRASSLRDQFKDVATNLLKAQNSARMAREQRAERLSLVEPPDLPDHPFSPNRPLLISGGTVAGLMIGLLLVLGLELVSRPVRSPAQIHELGLPVLGVVPTLQSIKKPRRKLWFFNRAKTVAR